MKKLLVLLLFPFVVNGSDIVWDHDLKSFEQVAEYRLYFKNSNTNEFEPNKYIAIPINSCTNHVGLSTNEIQLTNTFDEVITTNQVLVTNLNFSFIEYYLPIGLNILSVNCVSTNPVFNGQIFEFSNEIPFTNSISGPQNLIIKVKNGTGLFQLRGSTDLENFEDVGDPTEKRMLSIVIPKNTNAFFNTRDTE